MTRSLNLFPFFVTLWIVFFCSLDIATAATYTAAQKDALVSEVNKDIEISRNLIKNTEQVSKANSFLSETNAIAIVE
jgi:hypothetical protein